MCVQNLYPRLVSYPTAAGNSRKAHVELRATKEALRELFPRFPSNTITITITIATQYCLFRNDEDNEDNDSTGNFYEHREFMALWDFPSKTFTDDLLFTIDSCLGTPNRAYFSKPF
ncbi:hypothetical protein M0804_007158 [Polistes exclamans]|nr:hypothetical protein M0804_007158 [Polistes exclamans]